MKSYWNWYDRKERPVKIKICKERKKKRNSRKSQSTILLSLRKNISEEKNRWSNTSILQSWGGRWGRLKMLIEEGKQKQDTRGTSDKTRSGISDDINDKKKKKLKTLKYT